MATTNYNLAKPVDADSADISVINANMDIIDANIGNIGNKKVDEISRADGKVLAWDSATDKYKHINPTTGGTGSVVTSSVTNGNIKIDGVETTVYTLQNNSVIDTVIGTRTADPTTPTAYSLVGSLTQWLSWITKRFAEVTGYAWGTAVPASLKTLWTQADIGTLFIPAGILYSPIIYAGRNKTYNKVFINCHGETPTSLVVTLYHNGALIYTSSAITVNETIATVALTITGEQTVQAFVSNTTGLTKGVSVSLKQVSR